MSNSTTSVFQGDPSKAFFKPNGVVVSPGLRSSVDKINKVTLSYIDLCARFHGYVQRCEQIPDDFVAAVAQYSENIETDLQDNEVKNFYLNQVNETNVSESIAASQFSETDRDKENTSPPPQESSNIPPTRKRIAESASSFISAKKPRISPSEQPEAVAIANTKKAVEAFSREPVLENAQKMLNQRELISESSTSEARTLVDNIQEQLGVFFTPEIPEAILLNFMVEANCFEEQIKQLQLLPSRTFQEIQHREALEEYLHDELRQLKERTLQNLHTQHWISLDSDFQYTSLTLFYRGQPARLQTPLTLLYSKVAGALSKLQEERHENMLAFLRENFEAQEMGGNGDCLFLSLAGAIGQNVDASQIRADIVAHMKKNKAKYAPLIQERIENDDVANAQGISNLEQYFNWMSTQGAWGGEPEIRAFSEIQKRPLVVVQEQFGNSGTNTFNIEFAGNPIVIKNLGAAHFQAMMPKRV